MRFDHQYIQDPHGFFGELREGERVQQVEMPNGLPVWVLSRYSDVSEALADTRLSIDNRYARNWPGFVLPPELNASLMNIDPPDHTRLRSLVSKAFSARRVERLRDRIQVIADRLLDAVPESGRGDLNELFAAPLPLTVIGELLGMPESSHAAFRGWLSAMLMAEAGYVPADEAARAVGAIVTFLRELVADKRDHPGDDLLSDLIALRSEEGQLSEHELTSLVFLIFSAGYETTVGLIGNAVIALSAEPDQWAKLCDRADLVDSAVEEVLRYDGPTLIAVRRFATEDLTIAGQEIAAGDTVVMSIASANRDEQRFAGTDLDIERAVNPHIGFGRGPHFCLGASLARLEGRIALETLTRRFPDLRLARPAEELEWRPSIRTRGTVELPVTFWPEGGPRPVGSGEALGAARS